MNDKLEELIKETLEADIGYLLESDFTIYDWTPMTVKEVEDAISYVINRSLDTYFEESGLNLLAGIDFNEEKE